MVPDKGWLGVGKRMKFGIFDHIDDAGVPLGQLYADRMTIDCAGVGTRGRERRYLWAAC
jgi:hypothetical protein